MENYLFRASLPYCVRFEGKKVYVLNREYKTLFVGFLDKSLTLESISGFAVVKDQDFTVDEGGRVYLYDYTPIGENEELFKYDELQEYYKRLTSLMEFCAGMQYTNESTLNIK